LKKYLILLLVILATGCIFKGHYEGSGISFDYPMGWVTGTVMDLPGAIVVVEDISRESTVFIFKEKANTTLEERYLEYTQKMSRELSEYCYKQISNRTLTVDGSKAYEIVYTFGCDQTQTREQTRTVILQKGDYFYIIECKTTPENFKSENPNFDIIINSLDIL